jgi:hypothetical protein
MKFKKGDQVIPISKSIYGKLSGSGVWERAKQAGEPYLTIQDIDSLSEHIMCSKKDEYGGDYFLANDLIPYAPYKNKEELLNALITGHINSTQYYILEKELTNHEIQSR